MSAACRTLAAADTIIEHSASQAALNRAAERELIYTLMLELEERNLLFQIKLMREREKREADQEWG